MHYHGFMHKQSPVALKSLSREKMRRDLENKIDV